MRNSDFERHPAAPRLDPSLRPNRPPRSAPIRVNSKNHMPRRNELATAKAEETRERILASALELFRVRGFDATTMRDVASEAGGAPGAAYHYFGSKQDLVMALYQQTAREMAAALPAELAPPESLE